MVYLFYDFLGPKIVSSVKTKVVLFPEGKGSLVVFNVIAFYIAKTVNSKNDELLL